MSALLDALAKAGWPLWFIVLGALAVMFFKGDLKLLAPRGTKSDREMLSADEKDFRDAMIRDRRALADRLAACEARYNVLDAKCRADAIDAQNRYNLLAAQLIDVLNGLKKLGQTLHPAIATTLDPIVNNFVEAVKPG